MEWYRFKIESANGNQVDASVVDGRWKCSDKAILARLREHYQIKNMPYAPFGIEQVEEVQRNFIVLEFWRNPELDQFSEEDPGDALY